MKKNLFFNVLSLVLVAVSALFGGGVAMAATTAMEGEAAALPEGGTTISDAGAGATITTGMEVTEDADPDFYAKAVDERITRMRPMRTPIDQIGYRTILNPRV